jgi:FKBP-type peptidyl-prolyl cis-trans isomerase FkpA
MKKYLLLLSVVIMGLSACKKGDVTAEQAAVDDAKIQAYMVANGVTATKDPSGLYYKVIKTGTGAAPTANSTVKVAYTGKLLNGSTFEMSSSSSFPLSGTIKGWQIGLLKANANTLGVPNSEGRILLIIPSALAYGTTGNDKIAANSVLIFTIDVIGVN